uniref:Uncharacterized protein n=1 Tax=Caenorhabditis japonica TaxID=281687 RepID=A0A8R1I577_CAEJA
MIIIHLQLLFWSILLHHKTWHADAQNMTACAYSMGCLTVWELQGDTIRHLGVTPVSYDDEKHKKFLIRIGKHKIDTPHCFFNAVDGDEDEERHRIWCYCLHVVKEKCGSRKAIGEAIYQWKRDSSSRVNMKIRGRPTSTEVLNSALNAFSNIYSHKYKYNVSLESCKLDYKEILANFGIMNINIEENKTLVANIRSSKLMEKNSESIVNFSVPMAVLSYIRKYWEKSMPKDTVNRKSLRCVYKNFREQIVDPILKKYGMGLTSKMQTPRKMPLIKTRSSDDWLQYLPTICCWLLAAPFVIPLLLTAIGALVDWKDEERCQLSGDLRDVEAEIREEIRRKVQEANEVTAQNMSLKTLHMAVSIEPTNDTDLGSETMSTVATVPTLEDVPKRNSKEGKP